MLSIIVLLPKQSEVNATLARSQSIFIVFGQVTHMTWACDLYPLVYTCHRAHAYMPDDIVWHCHLHVCHLCLLAWPIQPHLPDDVLLGAIGRSPEPNCLLALTPLFGWRRSWVGGTKTFDKRQSILINFFLHILDIPGFSSHDPAF